MYKIELTKISDSFASCDEFSDSGSFLQSPMWAEFKSRHGWKKLLFSVSVENTLLSGDFSVNGGGDASAGNAGGKFSCSVLVRSFAKNIFSLAYIPMMPLFAVEKNSVLQNSCESVETERVENVREYSEFLCDFAKALKKYLPRNTICVRYDLPIDFATVDERDFFNTSITTLALAERFPLRKNKVDVQPPDTVLLGLEKSEDEILANMKSKWRYNVRLAEKKGMEVRAVLATDDAQKIDDALEVFYSLYKTTAERDGIAIHAKSYYRDLFSLCATHSCVAHLKETRSEKVGAVQKEQASAEQSGAGGCASACGEQVSLYTAYHEGDALAAIITLFTQNEAVYLYGASSNVKRNMMPAYLLQWTAICDAKKFGSRVYDFYGIPPTDDETHPMHGLYLFKTGFGGQEVHRPGSYDVPLSAIYNLYTFAENVRAFFFKKVKKIFRKR